MSPSWTHQKCSLAVILALLLVTGAASLSQGISKAGRVSAEIQNGKRIYIQHRARSGDSYILISKRWTGSSSNWRAIKRCNGNRRLLAGSICRVPYYLLSLRHKYSAIVTLFPSDQYKDGEWSHKVTYRGETVSSIASWLTGSSKNASKILAHNKLRGVLLLGSRVNVPDRLLLDIFKTGGGKRTDGSRQPSRPTGGGDTRPTG